MKRSTKLAIGAALALALALGGAAVLVVERNAPHEDGAAARGSEGNHAPSAAEARSQDAGSTAGKRAARVLVPRFVPAAPGGTDGGAPLPRRPRLSRASGDLHDRREKKTGDPAVLMARLKALFERTHERTERCLEQWSGGDPSLEAGILLAITIDANGLDQVWIEDRAQLPHGPLACISTAVYEEEWSGLTTEPLKITRRIRYEAVDGGPR